MPLHHILLEAMKIAAVAEAYEVNCAPHNFYRDRSACLGALVERDRAGRGRDAQPVKARASQAFEHIRSEPVGIVRDDDLECFPGRGQAGEFFGAPWAKGSGAPAASNAS
jgi:hypothetical protein